MLGTLAEIEHLIVFTRYPQPGQAKTRLIPALGAEGAAALQRQMTEHTLRQVTTLVERRSLAVEIWFAGTATPAADRQQMREWLGSAWSYVPQAAGDLGDRLADAVQSAFAAGGQRVVVIGTDCPELGANQLRQAFQLLEQHDAVLGPATDGGYYLIGLRRFVPDLFRDIAWSTAEVLRQTVAAATRAGLTMGYLAPLTDIDRPDNLPIWAELDPDTAPALSIVIPALNEANRIGSVLQFIQASQDVPIELIVVDGGSQDDTVAIVLTCRNGRAAQMNRGAEIATGQVLLFLHADTRLPECWLTEVQRTLSRSGVVAGAFELRIDGQEPGLRLVEWGVKWRSRLLQLPYGDQALFLRSETFQQLGGFPELPIMEDFVLVRRLQSLGKIAIVSQPVITSARRWQKLGIFKTTLINQLVIAAYFLGISPDRIARWYRQQ
jgi:uncharacterized protein